MLVTFKSSSWHNCRDRHGDRGAAAARRAAGWPGVLPGWAWIGLLALPAVPRSAGICYFQVR